LNSLADHVFHSTMVSFDMPLAPSGLTQDNLALDERRKVLYGLLRSTPGSNDINFVPKLTSMLQGLIPERFDGEISNKLQLLLDPSSKCSIVQVIEFALYFLSNNRLAEKQTDEFQEWIIQQQSKELLRSLFRLKTPTVHAFSNKILESIARTGNANTLQLLINSGIDISSLSGSSGGRYLQLALYHRRTDVARLLLEVGTDVRPPLDYNTPFNRPLLYYAVSTKDIDILRRLIKAGAKVDAIVNGWTALSRAVYEEWLDCIRLLLEAGADVDVGEIHEEWILDWAYRRKKDLYRVLLPSSRKSQTSLTISGILCAATRSSQALSRYLGSGERIKDPRRRQTLESALCYAIDHAGNSDAIKVLLDFGVDPNVDSLEVESPPLASAVWSNDLDLVGLLLEAGADIDKPGVLATAAGGETNFETLSFLIEQGADVEAFGGEALCEAIFGRNFAAIKLLLKSGVNINDRVRGRDSRTPLQYTAYHGELKVVQYLVKAGADVNAPPSRVKGRTALHEAAASGYIEKVKFLLESGADVNSQPNRSHGQTVLEASLDGWRSKLSPMEAEIFELLLNEGAHINGPRRRRRCWQWNSALTMLIAKSAENRLIQLALTAGADVNQFGSGREARSPIQAAAEIGNLDILKQLLEKGAEINAPPGVDYGRTALQAACCNKNPNLELIRFLLGKGAEVNASAGINGGLTALQGAAIQGHIKIALMLLDAGAEVNADPAEIEGRTALDGAAEHGRLDMVQLLLNAGAKSEPGETAFATAIELAENNGHFAVAELIRARSKRDSEES
jgi:ankyrin repeat protein